MIRFATIGRSWIARLWLDNALTLPGFALAAVYSRDLAAARAFAQEYGANNAHDNLDALANDPSVDAVYIASPNLFHYEQSMRMLKAGKHVLVEKPMSVTRAQAEAMYEAADQSGVVLLEATRNILNPAMERIRDALPSLGTLRRAHLRFCQYSSKYDRFKAGELPNTFNPALATGGLMDLGVYPVEVMAYLFGAPQRVAAVNHMLAHGWDAMGTLICEYPGMQSVITYSKITQGYAPSEIQGEDGALSINHITELSDLVVRLRTGEEHRIASEPVGSDMMQETRAFLDIIAGKRDGTPYRRCSLTAMGIMEDARQQFARAHQERKTGGPA